MRKGSGKRGGEFARRAGLRDPRKVQQEQQEVHTILSFSTGIRYASDMSLFLSLNPGPIEPADYRSNERSANREKNVVFYR